MRKLLTALFLIPLVAQADMLGETVKGTTDYSVELKIINSADGTPETGVVFNTAGIDIWYRREGALSTDITEATLAALTTAHADGGFLHINDGVYRVDLPDAAVATGADYVYVGGTVTGMIVIGGRVKLTDVDMNDGVRGGMTALPNAAADAAGGLPISDAGGLDLDGLNTNVNDIETDTADMQPKLGTFTDHGGGATVAGNLNDIEGQTDDIGVAGAGLTESGGTGDQFTGLPNVTVGTNNDKTGYSLTQTFPTNFADLSITATTGRVDVAAVAGTAQTANDNGADINAVLVDTADMQPKLGTYSDLGSGATLSGNLEDMRDDGTAVYSRTTDSLQALRDRGDAAWTTGSGTGLTAIASGTAQSATATTLVLAAGETFADDELIGALVQVTGGSTGVGQTSCIRDNVGSTDTITVDTWVTTPTGTITYEIAPGIGKTCPLQASSGATSLNVTASGNVGIDWANVENPTTTVNLSGTTVSSVSGSVGSISGVTFPTNFGSMVISGAGATDSLLQGFLNNTIAETTADRISGNFEVFWDNANAQTTNTVDNVGSGGGGDATAANQTTILSRLGTPSDLGGGASVAGNLSDIEGQTDDIGVAGAGLTSVASAASVAALNNLSQADVRTATGLASANLDTQLAALPTANEAADALSTSDLNCEVNTANFAGSATTLACILTDRDGGAVTQASNDLEGKSIEITSGAQIREERFINDTTWDAANSELQLTLSRALPATLADAVTAVIR